MESVKLGLIADIQYCDKENGWNYTKTRERFYRNGVIHLDNALEVFSANHCHKLLQLGDLMDGQCRSRNQFDAAYELLSKSFERDDIETFHVLGNHELYNQTRKEFCNSFMGKSLKKYQKLDIEHNYYRVDLSPRVSLIVLDTSDVSILCQQQTADNHVDYLAAKKILTENNTNPNQNSQIGATKQKYVAYNGAIGKSQLEWLRKELVDCTIENRIVLLSGHVPIFSNSDDPLFLIWNDEEVIEVINEFTCVKAYICGHNHVGEIVRTSNLIQINMPGVIESKIDEQPYGILEVGPNNIRLSALKGFWEEIVFSFNEE